MIAQRSRLLIAVEAEELFRRFENYIASDVRAEQNLRAQHCLPTQLDSKLCEHDTDASGVVTRRPHSSRRAAWPSRRTRW